MTSPEDLKDIERRLSQARRAIILRLTGRATAVFGMALLAVALATMVILWKIELKRLPVCIPLFAAILGATVLAGFVALILAWRRHRDLAVIASQGQAVFPELGLRLSASLEAPGLGYCPPSIRNALWRDTLARLERVPWRRFVAWLRTHLWLTVALLILLIQMALLWPPARRALLPKSIAAAIAPTTTPSPPDPQPDPANPQTSFKASLEITDPGKDQWATKIEAIPLKVQGESPLGFEKLHLSVSVNGQPPKDFPLDAERLPKDPGAATGSLCLDELELQDYDVVSYSVAGEAAKPGGGSAEITSPIYFVQIRPFRKDVLESESAGGDKMKEMVNLLYWLIEEDRRITRGTWLLKSDAVFSRDTQPYDEAARAVLESQRTALKTTIEAYAHFGAKAEDAVPAEVLTLLDKARESMEAAIPPLEHREWASAIPPEQQALSKLVEILRNIQEIIQKSKGRGSSDARQEQETLKDRQTHRNESEIEELARRQDQLNQDMRSASDPKAAAKDRIDRLARQQEQLNQDMAPAPRPESTATPASQKSQALGERQQKLAGETSQAAGETGLADAARQTLNEARQAMEQSAGALAKDQRDPARQSGQQARELLAKAAEQQEQAAGPPDGSASASRPANGPALAGRQQELTDKASQAAGKSSLGQATRQSLNEAHRAMQQAANALAKDQRDPAQAAGRKARELLDQAAAQEAGLRMQAAARELEDMLRKMGEHQGELRKEDGRTTEKQAAAGRDLEAMGKGLKDLSQQAGENRQKSFEEAATKTGEAGKELAAGRATPETLDAPMQAVARALQETRGRAEQLARLEQELRQTEQQMQGLLKRLENKSSDPNGPPNKPGDLSPAAKECLQALQERNGSLTAELHAALGTSAGMDHWNAISRIPYCGAGGGVEIRNIKDWLQAVQLAHRELETQLRRLTLSDELSAMRNEDSPPEYRDLVSAYFERLSREYRKKPPPTAPAPAPTRP